MFLQELSLWEQRLTIKIVQNKNQKYLEMKRCGNPGKEESLGNQMQQHGKTTRLAVGETWIPYLFVQFLTSRKPVNKLLHLFGALVITEMKAQFRAQIFKLFFRVLGFSGNVSGATVVEGDA